MTVPAPSFDDLFNVAIAEIILRDPAMALLPGDVSDAISHAIAAVGDAAVRSFIAAVRRTFIDGAKGQDLDDLILDHITLARVPAVQSIGAQSVSRAGNGPAYTFPIGHRFGTLGDATGNQIVIELTQAMAWALNETGTKLAAARAVATGPGGNAAIGTVIQILDATTDPTFTTTNPAAYAGGAVEQDDPSYRAAARAFWTTLARATIAALIYGAKQVPQIKIATVTESETALVTVYVADQDGGSNAQMVQLAVTELENWRAAGAAVQVTGGAVQLVSVQYRIIGRPGFDPTPFEPLIDGAMRNRIAQLGAGETMYFEMLRAPTVALAPLDILSVVITVPATEITPAANTIIRLDTISRVP
jgi:hypothetical protein